MNAVEYDESVEKVAGVLWSYMPYAEESEIYPLTIDAVRAYQDTPKYEWAAWIIHTLATNRLTEGMDYKEMGEEAYEAIKGIKYP